MNPELCRNGNAPRVLSPVGEDVEEKAFCESGVCAGFAKRKLPTSIGHSVFLPQSGTARAPAPQPRSFLLSIEKITSLFRSTESTKTKSRFDQWDAAAYIQLAANPEYRSSEALTTVLTANFISFAAEYTRGEVVSRFPMTVSPTAGLMGMLGSYTTGMLGMGELFEQKLEEQHKSPSRAQLETQNMCHLDHWAVAAPIGSLFVWNSPPGLVSEGYAGLNSHSFIFVYEKVTETEVVLHQFRTWMSLAQHAQFQSFLQGQARAENTTGTAQKATSHQIIANTHVFSADSLGCATSAEAVALIEKKAYETAQTWSVSPEEMPVVDETKYSQFRDFLLSLYLSKVVPLLLAEVPECSSAQEPVWQEFVASKKYGALIQQLDSAFGILAYQPLAKWVEDSAENTNKKGFWQHLLGKEKNGESITSLPQEQIKDGLLTMYQLRLAQLRGERIEKDQANSYKSLAGVLLSTTQRGLSLGQCGLGTFIPTRLAATAVSAVPSAVLPAVPEMALSMGAREKSALVMHIDSLQFLPLVLSDGSTWFITAEHYAKYKQFFETTPLEYSPKGNPIGPCGWALRGDPRGNDELVLTASEYTQLQTLRAQLLADLQNNPEAGFEAFADHLLATSTSEKDQEFLLQVIELLRTALKKTVDFGDLLFNNFFDSFILFAHPLLATIAQKVDLSAFVLTPETTAKEVMVVFQAEKHTAGHLFDSSLGTVS